MREITLEVDGYPVKAQVPDETPSVTVEIPLQPGARKVTVTVAKSEHHPGTSAQVGRENVEPCRKPSQAP